MILNDPNNHLSLALLQSKREKPALDPPLEGIRGAPAAPVSQKTTGDQHTKAVRTNTGSTMKDAWVIARNPN